MYPVFLISRDLNLHDPKVLLKYLELSNACTSHVLLRGLGPPHTHGTGPAFPPWFLGRGRAETGRAYLSGMGLWFWGLEEGVWQLPHPHGHRRGDDGALGVHDGVEERLQVGLRVAPYVDDLVSGRRVVLAWIHCPDKTKQKLSPKKLQSRSKNKVRSNPQTFLSLFPHAESRAGNLESVEGIPSHSRVD